MLYSLSSLSILLLIISVYGRHNGPQPPIWPAYWKSDFSETTKLIDTHHTIGTIWYASTPSLNATRIDRANGRGDRYCGSEEPFENMPCSQFVVQGMRYLVYPTKKKCCACCSAAKGCGVVKRNWLTTANYTGQQKINGFIANTWEIKGLQENVWAQTLDGKPVQLDMKPNDNFLFDPKSFSTNPIPKEQFQLPDFCGSDVPRCGELTLCTIA